MSKRIGVVTGGGDCPGLNAVIRAVAKTAANRGWECIGVLGTSSRGKFSAKVGHGERRALPKELLDGVKTGMDALGLFALVSIGGDGSLSIAQQLFEHGIPIVGVPKTI